MSHYIHWEADVECPSCDGTGLYQGMAERDGAAVVCTSCRGTGKKHIVHEYTAFTERRDRKNVKRVYSNSGGYVITDKDITTDEGRIIRFSEAGCSYEEWKTGAEPKPIRDLHCPLQHYQQGSEKGGWLKGDTGPCHQLLQWGEYISKCADRNREECWAKHDRGEFFK